MVRVLPRLLGAQVAPEAVPLDAQPVPRVLELAASKVSDLTAFDHVGTDLTLTLILTLTRHRPQAVGGLDRSGAC